MEMATNITQEQFKAPIVKKGKRSVSKSDIEMRSSPHKKKRTSEDFLEFCSMVLSYTQYNSDSSEMLRAEYNTSPLDSTGTGDSYLSETSNLSYSSQEHNSSFDEDDSMDLVTCFCSKPYAGRPMIECSDCSVWIHLSCAKIRKTNIPDNFTCQRCRDARLTTRKSSRTRVENKRIVE
ncbi:PHD finger protein 23 [Patella vulgata]|uniref:PHD finger protein 23 n=1 Tax=Patella vulgata TaxID=6465 RepID=UPI002180751A|nr:PHD finger protein 23 [Patella vulgata]